MLRLIAIVDSSMNGQAVATLRQSAGLGRRFREKLAVGVGEDGLLAASCPRP